MEEIKFNGNIRQLKQDNGSTKGYINKGQEDEMEVFGYRTNKSLAALIWFLCLVTGGLLGLVLHWLPHWRIILTHSPCPLTEANRLLIIENYLGKYKSYFVKHVKIINIKSINDKSISQDESAIMKIHLENGTLENVDKVRVVWVKKLCYVWDTERMEFHKLIGLDKNISNQQLHTFNGLTFDQQMLRRAIYGYNTIEVPVHSIAKLFLLEILNPFYVFQMFTIAVWMCEGYYYYNIAIILMSSFGIGSSIIQTRKNQRGLHDTVRAAERQRVRVLCSTGFPTSIGTPHEVEASDLVPGDVIAVEAGDHTLPCDAALLTQSATCVLDESMLTGESIPVLKTALPNSQKLMYNAKDDSNHTLYCGTKIIQTRADEGEIIKAVVIRTGYLTTKGQLVRSILYPPPADFKFDQDSYKFIAILGTISAVGLIYTILWKSVRGMTVFDIIIKALDLITICIPPALPAAMTVGKIYALNRLKKHQIFCMNSRVINVSGSLNCICFDKTGTLTEDGLDMWGVVPIKSQIPDRTYYPNFDVPAKDPSKELSINDKLLQGMVSCHSLSLIRGKLSGDPLDVKMFESTKWTFEEPKPNTKIEYGVGVSTILKSFSDPKTEIAIVHQYQFSSTLQRMSVITKQKDDKFFEVFCKGSPEMIASLSRPESIPSNMTSELKTYTEQGYRVIAVGTKTLTDVSSNTIKSLTREDVECHLNFAGLIILENRLKKETPAVIEILREASFKVIMITGDNILTALSVARECGIVGPGEQVVNISATPPCNSLGPQLHYTPVPGNKKYISASMINPNDLESNYSQHKYAMTGQTWGLLKKYFPEKISPIVESGAVFARMSSDQKQQLIQELQTAGYCVAMCGDGANDCGALKAAHAGVSLSEAEASVASPFTSKITNVSCMVHIVREGRAALVTSFGIFKFMVTYALSQFTSAIILYTIDSNLTDVEFLFIDICLVVNFAFFLGKTDSYKGPIVKTPPQTSLLSLIPLMSLFFQVSLQILFQIASFKLITQFDWFVPFKYDPALGIYTCHQNYAVFAVSLYQYMTMAIVYSQGKPYRKPFFTNIPLTISIICVFILCTYIITTPADWIIRVLELDVPPSSEFKITVIILAFLNLGACLLFEDFIVNFLVKDKIKPMCARKRKNSTVPINYKLSGIDNTEFISDIEYSTKF